MNRMKNKKAVTSAFKVNGKPRLGEVNIGTIYSSASSGKIWRLLYVRQIEHMVCGCFLLPQLSQITNAVLPKAWCVRRLSRRVREIRRFGNGVIVKSL